MSLNPAYQESDFGRRAYLEQDDICRFCWTKDAQVNLFQNMDQNYIGNANELVHKVNSVLDIDLLSEECPKLPNKVCSTCHTKIDNFFDFKAFCQDSHRKLVEILKNIDNKPSTFIDETQENVKFENYDEMSESDVNYSDISNNFLENLQNSLDNEDNTKKPSKAEKKSKNSYYKQKKSKYYCTICCFNFKNRDAYSKHSFEAHGIEKNGLFKCFGCEKRFASKKHRANHERLFCKGLKNGFKCLICDRFLPQRRMYEAHMRDHRDNKETKLPEDIFKCKMCSQQFSSKENLVNHTKTHNVEKKKFVCETCGRQFSRQDYLYRHGLTHSGAKPYSCPQCPFRTAQRSTLTTHIRKHTGERPYACPMCPQRCVTASNLLAHTRRHTAPPTYQCTLCPKKFGYKTGLQEHIESVHEKVWHICPHCGIQYARIRGLKRHILAKHNETTSKNYNKNQPESEKVASERNIQIGGINDNEFLRETERQAAFQSVEVSQNTKIVLYDGNKNESEVFRETERQTVFQSAENPNSAKILLYAGNKNENTILREMERQTIYQDKNTVEKMNVLYIDNNINITKQKDNEILLQTERQTVFQSAENPNSAKILLYAGNKNENAILRETERQTIYQDKNTVEKMNVLYVDNNINIANKKDNEVLRQTERETAYQAPDVGSIAKMAVLYVDNKTISNENGNSKQGPVFLKLSDKIVCLDKGKLYIATQNET